MANAITDINQLNLDGNYTYADYLKWQFTDRLELLKGKIFKMSPAPSRLHQGVLGRLHWSLQAYFKNKNCNIYLAPFDVRLVKVKTTNEKTITVVQPDLCIICDASKLDDKGCNGAPDLIVEILSPGNSKKEMGIKFELYQENGVQEYWIIDPQEKTILVYTAQNNIFIGHQPLIEDVHMKSKLFPEINFLLKDIFIA